MTKKAKFLFILLILALVLVLYLLLTSEQVAKIKESRETAQKEQVDLTKLENDYKEKARMIFSDYLKLTEEADLSADKIEEIKNKLLALKVPAKFKELHLNMVLAMNKMENFLSGKGDAEKITSQQIIAKIKANYVWLN